MAKQSVTLRLTEDELLTLLKTLHNAAAQSGFTPATFITFNIGWPLFEKLEHNYQKLTNKNFAQWQKETGHLSHDIS